MRTASTSFPSVVTLSHEDFEQLQKMAHGDTTLPSAAMDNAGISTSFSPTESKWLIDSGALDHMAGDCHLFSTFTTAKPVIQVWVLYS